MCDPVSMAAVAGGTAVLGEIQANDERRKANKIKEEAAALHGEVFQNKVDGVARTVIGQQFATFEAKNQRKIDGMKARALSQVSASASGVEGLSVDAILDDFTQQVGTGSSAIDQQLDIAKGNTAIQLKSLQLGTKGQLFNLRKEEFNPVASALRIGGAVFGGFAAGKQIKGPSASNPVATNTGNVFGPPSPVVPPVVPSTFNNPGGRFR